MADGYGPSLAQAPASQHGTKPVYVVSTDWDSLGGRNQGTQITYLWKLQNSTRFLAPEVPLPNPTHLVHTVPGFLLTHESNLLC